MKLAIKLDFYGFEARAIAPSKGAAKLCVSGLSAGSLLMTKSRKVAELILRGGDEVAWARFIKVESELQKRSPASGWRQMRLLRNRFAAVSHDYSALSYPAPIRRLRRRCWQWSSIDGCFEISWISVELVARLLEAEMIIVAKRMAGPVSL